MSKLAPTGWVVIASLALTASIQVHATDSLTTVEFAGLQKHSGFAMRAAREWSRSGLVSFTLDGGASREGERIGLAGWIVNASPEPQIVVTFPVGNLGFLVQPAPGTIRKRLGPPISPPAPPPPLAFTLPAHSRVRVETSLYLSDWEWNTDVPREIDWSFQFWNEPKPRGRLAIQ